MQPDYPAGSRPSRIGSIIGAALALGFDLSTCPALDGGSRMNTFYSCLRCGTLPLGVARCHCSIERLTNADTQELREETGYFRRDYDEEGVSRMIFVAGKIAGRADLQVYACLTCGGEYSRSECGPLDSQGRSHCPTSCGGLVCPVWPET